MSNYKLDKKRMDKVTLVRILTIIVAVENQ